MARCRERGIGVLAADGQGQLNLDRLQDQNAARRLGAPPLESDYALENPTAWLFGNEAQGLAEEELALADHRVAVPVYGAAESLNLGTAATVCLYASARSQQEAQQTRPADPRRGGAIRAATGGTRNAGAAQAKSTAGVHQKVGPRRRTVQLRYPCS